MKQTDEDRSFAEEFSRALQPFITREQNLGRSFDEIAKELGVTGPGLRKQLSGGTPSVRTVALAYALYGVSVPYQGVDFLKAMHNKKKRKRRPGNGQLLLPFEITAPVQTRDLRLKLLPHGVRKYRLHLTISNVG